MILANLLFTILIACTGDFRSSTYEFSEVITMQKEDTLSYQVLESPGHTFGYEIFIEKKLLIHQAAIPGLPGLKGFARKEDAEKVAQLVIKKIKQGMMPPTIDKSELDSLKIIY